MYSEKIITANLEAFAREEKWEPVYHTLAQVQEFTEYINKITKKNSTGRNLNIELSTQITEKRARDIRQWIINEQVLCALDSGYFESRYAYVCDEQGDIFKFANRKSQQIFDNILSEFDELMVAIEILFLKARQVGITTKTALKFLHRLLFISHTQAVMGSVDEKKSELITRIIETCIEMLPWWLPPQRTTDRIKMIGFVNGSILSVQSGNQATGIAQGWTPTCFPPDTLVRTLDGRFKKISELTQEDCVLTHEGRFTRVKRAWNSHPTGDITRRIKLWGNYQSLECSLDQGLLTPESWTPASDITVGDYLCHPIRKILRLWESLSVEKMSRGFVSKKRVEKFDLKLTPELGYVFGFYLAEGYVHQSAINHAKKKPYFSEVIFTTHTNEVSDRLSRLRDCFGDKQHFKVSKTKTNAAHISMSCAWFARLVADEFGTKKEKTVPDWVWNAGQEFCAQLVRGYLDGDGHYDDYSNNVITPSVCRALIYQMRDLVASCGFGWCSIYHKDSYTDKNEVNHSESWRLILSGPTGAAYREKFELPLRPHKSYARHWRFSGDGNFVEIEVESVSDGFSESLWDVEIDDRAHSFCIEQCVAHNCVHISEIGDIPNPKKTLEEGLLRATHPTRKLFQVWEGTGNGNTGYQADKWRASKEDWVRGRARLRPVFINWPMATDLYPPRDWMRKFPFPESWRPLEVTRKHVQRCELFVRTTPYLAKVAGAAWRMPREQQWYWEFNYLEAVKTHTQKIWLSQMPADDYEALQGKNDLVFDPIVIDTAREQRNRSYQAYAITGDSIDDGFEPADEEIDYSRERIRVSWRSHRGQRFEWIMVPLLPFDESDERKSLDKILIFEEPGFDGNKYDYSIGIDTADGLGHDDEDRSVCSITRSMKGENCDVQVAEFCSNRVNAPQMVGFAACLAAWYGENCIDSRGCKFAIEQRERPGDDCQLQLKLMGFNFHHIDTRYDNKDVKENKGHKQGWYTNAWSRPLLMNRFVDAVENGWYKPNSPFLIEELQSLERKVKLSGKSRMEHQSGRHDDRVLAAATSYFTRHALDVMAERSQKRYAPPANKLPELDFSHANLGAMEVGNWE